MLLRAGPAKLIAERAKLACDLCEHELNPTEIVAEQLLSLDHEREIIEDGVELAARRLAAQAAQAVELVREPLEPDGATLGEVGRARRVELERVGLAVPGGLAERAVGTVLARSLASSRVVPVEIPEAPLRRAQLLGLARRLPLDERTC